MPTITLCEQQQLAPNQFAATLRFEGGGSYSVTITNPFSEQQEAGLEWYLTPVRDMCKNAHIGLKALV